MLICDRCQTPISDGSRFCPACGDPVTGADRPGSRAARATERVQLVCPACDRQSLFDIPAHGVAQETCPRCEGVFGTRVVRVKSKRSAGNRKLHTRSFTVRVEDLNGREDVIEFDRPSNDDFELRSRDLAAFSSRDGRLAVVQNLTVGRYMRLASPLAPGCGGGSVAVASVLLVLFLGFCGVLLNDSPSPGPGSAPLPGTGPAAVTGPVAGADSTELLHIHDALNVRAAPNPNATRVRALSRGDLVRLGPADANGWAPIYDVSGGREGYVYRASGRVQRTAPEEAPSRSATAPSSTGGRRSGGSSSGYTIGPRGGCYTYSASGRKRYVDRSYCY